MKNRVAVKDYIPAIYGMVILLGFFYIIYCLLTKEFPSNNKDLLSSFCETVKNVTIMLVSFYFGASASGKAKDDVIGAIAQAAPLPGTGSGIGERTGDRATDVDSPPGRGGV